MRIKMPYHTARMAERVLNPVWEEANESWMPPRDEGQLSVDIFRDRRMLVVRSPVAGVDPENLDIAIHDDLLTIRGSREMREEVNEDDWFYQECYWGEFGRSIILPADVYPERAEAVIKNGVLEIRLPIREGEHRVTVRTIPVVE